MTRAHRILVTGVTGFIGRHLVAGLSGRGYVVHGVCRHRPAAPFDPVIEHITVGDIGMADFDWRACLSGMDVVVHLAGIAHQESVTAEETYQNVNRRATARLAEVAKANNVRLIFLSSVAAQTGPSTKHVLTEGDVPRPRSPYGYSKLSAEKDIAAIGGRYFIIRPPLVYGAGVRGNMAKLIRLAQMPLLLPFGGIENLRTLVSVENLVDAIILVAEFDSLENGIYLVGDEHPISLPGIITALRSGFRRPAGLITVPPMLLRHGFKLLGMRSAWERMTGNLVLSTKRLLQAGYSPKIRTEDGLRSLAASLQSADP